MFVNEKLKKFLALGLAVSVMSLGLLSASTSTASASSSTVAPTNIVSQNGKNISVSVGQSKINVAKSDDFHANIDLTTKAGIQNIELTVTPLPNQKYQIETFDKKLGKSYVVTSDINPLSKDKFVSKSTATSPYVIISILFSGTASYTTLATAVGAQLAGAVWSSRNAIMELYQSSGLWAVVALIAGWDIVGGALIVGLVV